MAKELLFRHQNLTFRYRILKGEHPDDAEAWIISHFDIFCSDFVMVDSSGTPVVDWKRYAETSKRQGSKHDILIHIILYRLGVLCDDEHLEYWTLDNGSGLTLDPARELYVFHFVREEDARGYAKAVYAKAQFPVILRHVIHSEKIN